MWKLRSLGKSKLLRNIVIATSRKVFSTGKVVTLRRGPLKGLQWYCHKQHQFWMPLGLYEKETATWLRKKMSSETHFYDIGSNAGYFLLMGSKYCKSVVGFEPVSTNVDVIKEHIRLNGISNISLQQLALSDKIGKINFTHEENNANSHITDVETPHAKNNDREIFSADTTTLDDFTAGKKIPTLIKIDVEGAEVLVLKGAKELLTNNSMDIILSTHSSQLKIDCRKLLESYGYSCSELSGFEHEIIASKVS